MNMEATWAIMVQTGAFLSAAYFQREGEPNARYVFYIAASTVKQVELN
jgi:hypothetical protein